MDSREIATRILGWVLVGYNFTGERRIPRRVESSIPTGKAPSQQRFYHLLYRYSLLQDEPLRRLFNKLLHAPRPSTFAWNTHSPCRGAGCSYHPSYSVGISLARYPTDKSCLLIRRQFYASRSRAIIIANFGENLYYRISLKVFYSGTILPEAEKRRSLWETVASELGKWWWLNKNTIRSGCGRWNLVLWTIFNYAGCARMDDGWRKGDSVVGSSRVSL